MCGVLGGFGHSLLQQPGPKKFKLSKIELIYIRPQSLKFPRSLSKDRVLRFALPSMSTPIKVPPSSTPMVPIAVTLLTPTARMTIVGSPVRCGMLFSRA